MSDLLGQTACVICGNVYDTELDEIGEPLATLCSYCLDYMDEPDEEYDCPIHGKLGGIDECPRC
jgi:exonuclease I